MPTTMLGSLSIFVATRPEDVPDGSAPFLSLDGSVPGFSQRWDHHVTGERINLDAMPELVDLSAFRGVGTTLADADAVCSVVAALLGGKARLPAEVRAMFESASHWCDHITPHPAHGPDTNRQGRGLLDAIDERLAGPPGQVSARFADICRELAACITRQAPLPQSDRWPQQLRLAAQVAEQSRVRVDGTVALLDLRGFGVVDPGALYTLHSCPVAVFVEEHPSGGPRYTVGVNPNVPERPHDLRPALRQLASAEFSHGAPARSAEPVPGSENWGGRPTVFGSPWNYGSRLAPEAVVTCLQQCLALPEQGQSTHVA